MIALTILTYFYLICKDENPTWAFFFLVYFIYKKSVSNLKKKFEKYEENSSNFVNYLILFYASAFIIISGYYFIHCVYTSCLNEKLYIFIPLSS